MIGYTAHVGGLLVNRSGAAAVGLVAALALGAGAERAAAASTINGLSSPPTHLTLGSIEAVPNGCLVEYAVTIVTDATGGQDGFELQVADDGRVSQIVPLNAPADGASHRITGQIQLSGPPGDETPGIGLYLVDDGQILDAVDPLGVPCSPLEVPALGGGGFAALGGVLALAALASLRRLRHA